MRVLVTGGAGYIGSHTAKLLAAVGHEVVVLDNLDTGHDWAVKWGPLVKGNTGDPAVVRAVLADHQPDAVIHFAAHAYVGESMQRPEKYFRNNVAGTLTLLEAILSDGVRPFVFSSTCATYGLPERVPIAETELQIPVNPYGESKLIMQALRQLMAGRTTFMTAQRLSTLEDCGILVELRDGRAPSSDELRALVTTRPAKKGGGS